MNLKYLLDSIQSLRTQPDTRRLAEVLSALSYVMADEGHPVEEGVLAEVSRALSTASYRSLSSLR